jgi:hypothetical protein
MTQAIQVTCAAGIDQLIELGRTVARTNGWAFHPLAREALVGLWLDAQLTRADLRGTAEVSAEQVTAKVDSTLVQSDAALIDQKLASWLQEAEAISLASGDTKPDTLHLSVTLPRQAGAWGLVVTVAVIAAVAGVTGVLGWRGIDAWVARVKGDQEMQARAAETAVALKVAQTIKDEQRPLNDAERAILETMRARQVEATKNLTTPPASKEIPWTELAIAALVLAGLAVLTRQNPK